MQQAQAITLQPQPTHVVGVFEVPSKTYPGQVYTTDVRDREHPICNCPAGQHDFESCKHVKTCWHVRACAEAQAELDRIRSRALIVRPQGMTARHEAFGPATPA